MKSIYILLGLFSTGLVGAIIQGPYELIMWVTYSYITLLSILVIFLFIAFK